MKLFLLLAALCLTFTAPALAQDEAAFMKLMKEAGGANGRVKKALEAGKTDGVEKDAARVAELFGEMGKWWEAKKLAKPVQWSKDAAEAAKAVVVAAKGGDVEKIKAAHGNFMKSCKSCHETHREKLPDGTSKIKY